MRMKGVHFPFLAKLSGRIDGKRQNFIQLENGTIISKYIADKDSQYTAYSCRAVQQLQRKSSKERNEGEKIILLLNHNPMLTTRITENSSVNDLECKRACLQGLLELTRIQTQLRSREAVLKQKLLHAAALYHRVLFAYYSGLKKYVKELNVTHQAKIGNTLDTNIAFQMYKKDNAIIDNMIDDFLKMHSAEKEEN